MADDRVKGVKSPLDLLHGLRLRHLGMAFFWACSMLSFRTSFLLEGCSDVVLYSTVLLLVSFFFNIVTLVIMAVQNLRQPGWTEKQPTGLFVAFVVAGVLMLHNFDQTNAGTLLFFLGAALTGVGFGYFWGSWAEVFGRFHPQKTSIALPLNLMLTLVLFLGMSKFFDFFDDIALPVMLLLPVLSWYFLEVCREERPFKPLKGKLEDYLGAIDSIGGLLLGAGFLSFVFGFMWETSMLSLSSVNEAHFIPLLVSLGVAVVLFLIVVFGRRRWDLEMLYRFTVPVIVLVFALFPMMFSQNPVLINALLNAGFIVFEILLWVLVAQASYDYRVSGFVVGAVGRGTFLTARLAGLVAGYFCFQLSDGSFLMFLTVSVFALFVVGMWLAFSRLHRKRLAEAHLDAILEREAQTASDEPLDLEALAHEAVDPVARDVAGATGVLDEAGQREAQDAGQGAGQDSSAQAAVVRDQDADELEEGRPAGESHGPSFQECCDLVTERYGLTRRESEVLPYLAQGRSARVIADALFVSENTVRTHIKHVLQKTGAGSKQDIIDFVRQEGARTDK